MELRMSHGFEIMSFFCSGPMTVFRACSLTMKKLGWPFLNEKWCSKHARCREPNSLQSCIQMQMEPYKCSLPNHPFFFQNNWNTNYSFTDTSASHLVCCVGFLLMQNHCLMKWIGRGREEHTFHQKQDEQESKWNSLSSELKHLACFYVWSTSWGLQRGIGQQANIFV